MLNWRAGLQALRRAWKPLLAYELLMSLLTALVVGPLFLTITYELIAISDDGVLGNWNLILFLLSPIGLSALVLSAGVTLGLLFVEYSGLILLADAALRGAPLTIRQLVAKMLAAAPRLFGLAVLQASLAILAAVPFVALAVATYWLLLGDADINYYVSERPPRFWAAVAIGTVLATGFALSTTWFCVRWAFAVPACVLDGQPWLTALRSSTRLVRGRAWRLLLLIGGWELLKQGVFVAAIVGLDRVNEVLLLRFEGGLGTLVAATIILLLFDAVVLQLVAAVFAIGLAGLLAYEYEQARQLQPDFRAARTPEQSLPDLARTASRTRPSVAAIAMLGPLASLMYALALEREFVEHRTARVTAHRAGPKAAPENSLAALHLSLAARADFVEIDVQQTADGHVVLLHDRDLRRVTGDARDLADVNLADLAQTRLRLGGASSEHRIPTLAEFIAACDSRIQLNIELKDFGRSQDLPAAVVDVLREQSFVDRVIVSSFELPLLAKVRRSEPTMPVGIIVSASRGDLTRLPVDFLSLNHRLVRADAVRRAHRRGMEVHAWTVNERETALRLLDLGCDNLITSDPALMRQIVDWYAGQSAPERMLLRLRRWIRE